MEQQNIKDMRDYSITRKKDEWYDTQVTDKYGITHQNYFETQLESEEWIYYIFENEKKPLTHDQEMEMLATAIWGCTKLDQELGLLKGNADNLD
tara:strand:+ start:223 stop:504 length:282 start_codon:yes stop_codon:yes gene_type:complete